ncbi:cytochrome P450 [Kitasatospora sp. McL0602]|uniref:cytochrome P450 n=1 Tax=Kitasatospora sp. McL0602 TaxID=3439530 RepID=UPI003F8C55A2
MAGQGPWPPLAHHGGPCPTTGHQAPFHEATVVHGGQASDYFRAAGITALADAHGGLCTFRLGDETALYQSTNTPLVGEADLAPSTAANSELFGDFMGSLEHSHPDRPAKRAVVEQSLGNGVFVEGRSAEIRRHTVEFLEQAAGRAWPTEEFVLQLVAHVDSLLNGVLDLRQRPLTHYLAAPEFGPVIRGFFDIASEVISKNNDGALRELDALDDFVRALLTDNQESLAAAPATNLITSQLALWGVSVADAAELLTGAQLKELATVVVATFDTTALSLLWLLCHLEGTPGVRARVLAESGAGRLTALDLAVLEAVRLGGSNPTALWRRTVAPVTLEHRGAKVEVPAGTMVWLDRRQANQDSSVFPAPERFALANIRAVMRSDRETVSSLISRSRYEINSFSMVNSPRNPRKCPGRLFSVRMQSVVAEELYGRYDVHAEGIDLRLRRHSSMPRPAAAGTIRIHPRSMEGQ